MFTSSALSSGDSEKNCPEEIEMFLLLFWSQILGRPFYCVQPVFDVAATAKTRPENGAADGPADPVNFGRPVPASRSSEREP
jgi:hypothetical protein